MKADEDDHDRAELMPKQQAGYAYIVSLIHSYIRRVVSNTKQCQNDKPQMKWRRKSSEFLK